MSERAPRLAVKLLVIVGASLAVLACQEGAGPREEEHAGSEVTEIELSAAAQREAGIRTARVERRPIEHVLETTGVVTPVQTRAAHIRPLARGIVEEVLVRLGDRVTAGQPLINYDNIELGDLIGEYLDLLGGLEKVEAQRNVAEKFLRRAEALLEVEAIARSEFELRQAEYEQAIAEVESQRASIARVEEKLHRFGLDEEAVDSLGGSEHDSHRTASHNVLRAPFDGIVTWYDVSAGEVVDQERELFTIVDTSTVWVLADVYEKDLGIVQAGGQARVTVASYPDEAFTGVIEYVADFLDPESRTAKVRCVVQNPDRRLKLEMFATVSIPATLAGASIAVPINALQAIGDETVVFVRASANRFVRRPITTGVRGDDWVQVLEGLDVGETVVTDGSFYLKSAVLRGSIGDEH